VHRDPPLVDAPFDPIPPRDGYDRWAPDYDAHDNPLVLLETPVVAALVGDVRERDVADIGCGTGRWTLRWCDAGARVTGVDFSLGMLDVLRDKLRARSLVLLEHDLTRGIPLPDAAFDVVTCCLVLEHLPDLPRAIAELGRICRPGGHVVISDLHPEMTRRGLHARFRDASGNVQQIHGEHRSVSDYVMAASRAGLQVDTIDEHVMDEVTARPSAKAKKYIGEPLLLAMRLVRA
jgi:ubiquinone/menaquinone biosynthesis C-methylase UbiE